MTIKWNNPTNPPISEIHGDSCNPYYIVDLDGYKPVLAMYIENEWWTSYYSKICVEVIGWSEI